MGSGHLAGQGVSTTAVRAGGGASALARRHPVAAFIALTLAWSWGVWLLLLPLVGRGGLMKSPPPVAFVIALVGGCGPSLVAIVLTAWIDGRAGLRALGTRLRHVHVGRWWLALAFIPGVTALTPVLRALTGHAQDLQAMAGMLVPGLALGLAAGLMEEIGWRGFLLPRLRARFGPFVAALGVGLVWGGLWHGYADYFGVVGEGPSFWLMLVLLGPGLLTAWSLVLTCLHERTGGSLAVSVLMHASLSSSALILGQHYPTRAEELGWTALAVALAWLGALVLWRAVCNPGRRDTVSAA